MSSGSTEEEPIHVSLFLSNVPGNEHLQVPLYKSPKERAARLKGLFYISLKFLIKIHLNKEIHLFSQREPKKGASLHVPQKRGPYGNRRPFPEPYLVYLRVTSEGVLPPVSSHRAPSERDAALLEPSFIHLSTSPVYEPPSRFPSRAPTEREAHLQNLPLHILQGPQQRGPHWSTY
jgi:hypothetical protein